jgi:(p)ppGpp synthase/HD superfamily hydrolase
MRTRAFLANGMEECFIRLTIDIPHDESGRVVWRSLMGSGTRHELWQQAASFAARCHAGQTRNDRRTPYIAHPFRVALVVRQVFEVDDEIAIAAALLHDVIEDTTADYDDLSVQFGKDVADTVAALTKDMRLPEEDREPAYDGQLSAASWRARLVKLADVYDNYCDSASEAARGKSAQKAARAIVCAGKEPRLAAAVEIVRALIGHNGQAAVC